MFLVFLQKVVKSEQFLISSGNKLRTCEAWSCSVLLINGLSNCKPLLVVNNGLEFDQPQDIANQFNIYFRDIGPQLA